MKTFQKLLTNSLLFAESQSQNHSQSSFAENRLCHKEGAEKQETQQVSPETKFEIGQIVEGYGLTKKDNVTVEKIEKVEGYDKVTLSDKTIIERVKFEFGKDNEKEATWLMCRKLNTGTYVDEQGENPLEFVPSGKDLIPESEAIKQLEDKATEAKKRLEEKKKEAIESVSEPNKEQAIQAIEEKYKKAADKIDELLNEAKTKIAEEREDDQVEKSTAEDLAKTFNVEVEKTSAEGEKEMGLEAEFKGKLKNPEDLHKWLENPENRKRMRGIVLVGNAGAKRYTVDFGKLKTALNLSDKEYKIAEKNLRIGNLLEDDVIKKITSVKTRGKEMVAKYFYEGGKKVKGIYTEKNKYIPIWNGTEIYLEPDKESALTDIKGGDEDFEKKVTKAKAASSKETAGEQSEQQTAEEAAAEGAPESAAGAAPEGQTQGTPESAATSSESRTAQGLDAMPSKPLSPTDSEDVKGAKEFNGITYKPNGQNFDLINANTEEVTNTVDAATLKVLTGQEIPTEEWMNKKIHEIFPYLKPDAKLTYVYWGETIKAFVADGKYFVYDLETGLKDGNVDNVNLTQYLKNTDASTLAQLEFDVREDTVIIDNISKGSLQEAIISDKGASIIELEAGKENPNVKILARGIYRTAKADFDKINTDLTAKIKPLLEEIIKVWEEERRQVDSEMVAILESINGGLLDQANVEALVSHDNWFDNFDKKAFFEKYKSNQKVVEWYLKEGDPSNEDILLLLKDYTGQPADEVVLKLADAYSGIDSLSLKEEEKTALKEKCKTIFSNYLTAHAKEDSPEKYKEIYELLYGDDITKLPDGVSKPSPEVYAKNFVLAGQDPFAAGIFDGKGWLAFDSQETNKYISAYLDAMTTVPSLKIPIEQADPTKEKTVASIIMELAKQSKNSLAQVFAAEIEMYSFSLVEGRDAKRLEEMKGLRQLAENTQEPHASRAIIALENQKDPIEEILKTESGRTALGFENKEKFDAWLNKQKALIQFEQGKFEEIDMGQLDDPAQKEFVEAYNDPSKINSYSYLKRILAAKGVKQESLKKIADHEDTNAFARIEICLALGLKGKAKETADSMTDEVAKNYYLSLFAETKEYKLVLLEKAIGEVIPKKEDALTAADLELIARILKELKNANKTPDQYKYKGTPVSILENLAGNIQMASDPDKKDFYNAILDIKLLNAEVEIAQCEDPNNPFASDHEGACDYKELVNEVKAYNDSLPEGQEMDKSMLERLHKLIGTNTDLIKDENAKKAYAELMVKIDKTEGLEQYITQDAAYLEKKGKYLNAAKAITDTSTPENLKKKKELLGKAFVAAGADTEKQAEVAQECLTIENTEARETAVNIYIHVGKYDEAIAIMKADGKVTEGFTKSKIDDLVTADQASKAEDVCLSKGLYDDLIERVYKVKKEMVVKLGSLFTAVSNGDLSYGKIFDFLMFEDLRTRASLTGASDGQKKAFLQAVKDKLTTDTIKDKIKGKLGIDQSIDDFLKESGNTEPAQPEAQETPKPEPAPAQRPAETQPAAQPTEQPAEPSTPKQQSTESPTPPSTKPTESPPSPSLEGAGSAIDKI
jgi:hypothetical protein